MSKHDPFAGAAAETTGAGFVAPKTLADLNMSRGASTPAATTTISVAQGGWAMEITVPKLSPEAAHQRTLEVHATARARNEREDARRRAKRATPVSTLG